jgi:IS605 OrfB family transposase
MVEEQRQSCGPPMHRDVIQHPHSLIGLEDLTHIRERTRRRTHTRKKNAKGVNAILVKQRKANAAMSAWSFAQLHAMIAYKALRVGSIAVKVDTNHTSQAYPCCGHTSKGNRPNI